MPEVQSVRPWSHHPQRIPKSCQNAHTNQAPPMAAFHAKLCYYDSLCSNVYDFYDFHSFMILGFLILIPKSKHLHLVLAPINIFFKPLVTPDHRPVPIDMEGDEKELEFSKIMLESVKIAYPEKKSVSFTLETM